VVVHKDRKEGRGLETEMSVQGGIRRKGRPRKADERGEGGGGENRCGKLGLTRNFS